MSNTATKVACIDIGTVTARLACADVRDGRVERMLKRSTICNLGEGLTRTGVISPEAAQRVLSCVDGYLALARQARVPRICCTLTSAARDAANSDGLLESLAARGLHAQVIPGEVEGRLTFLGVSQDFPHECILVADSGGGSTELALGGREAAATEGAAGDVLQLDFVHSVDVGARRTTERFLQEEDPPSAQDVSRARTWARGLFEDALARHDALPPSVSRLVVTGGTATSLVAVRLGLVPYDSRRVHLATLSRGDVDGLLERFAALSEAGRAKVSGLQPKRAPVILGGTVTIAALLDATGMETMTVSESDLLFGLAICAAAAVEGGEGVIGWLPTMARLDR